MPASGDREGDMTPRTLVVPRIVAVLLTGMPMSPRVSLGLQWVLTVYALSYFSVVAVSIGLLLPVWIVPIAVVVQRFIVADTGVARIVGGVAGGVLGAAIAHALIDWSTPQGLVTGIFFGTLVTGHVAAPGRQTSAFSLLAGTFLLLFTLGVFSDLKYFLQPSDAGFVAAAFAIVVWLYVAIVAKTEVAQKLWRRVRKSLGDSKTSPPAA